LGAQELLDLRNEIVVRCRLLLVDAVDDRAHIGARLETRVDTLVVRDAARIERRQVEIEAGKFGETAHERANRGRRGRTGDVLRDLRPESGARQLRVAERALNDRLHSGRTHVPHAKRRQLLCQRTMGCSCEHRYRASMRYERRHPGDGVRVSHLEPLRDFDDRGRDLRPPQRWFRTRHDHNVAAEVPGHEIDLRPVDDAIAVVRKARDRPRLLQVHQVGEVERAEDVRVGELIAQDLHRAGSRHPGVDPTRERDHERGFVHLGPMLDLDRDHVRNVWRGWIAFAPVRLRIFTEPQQGASYDQLLGVAQLSEALGFDAFFRSDHYQRIGDGPPGPGSTDAWVTLAAIGRETSRIRLGTLVTPVTFRFPGPLAIQVAQADAMSGGRVELGLGAGWYDGEHAAYGIPFPPTTDRFAMLEEQLEIVTGLWATPPGESYSFAGEHHSIVDSPGLPKPVQRPRPPIILGGWGTRRTPRLAARFADEFNLPFSPRSYFREGCDHVRVACERIDRDPSTMRFSAAVVVCVGRDAKEIERRRLINGGDPNQETAKGTPAEVVDYLREFEKLGADAVYLQYHTLDDPDHLHLIAEEVLPHV
jgi:F420-dependent oxidoreductase-like protein